jgi:3-methyl-2-oxobutanoate hydroxymethyltransferase
MRNTIFSIQELKKANKPITCLTAYSYDIARIIDEFVDVILVGDSLASVLYGRSSTTDISLDEIIAHAKAVVKASSHALVVVDMPFNTYRSSKEQAYTNAATILQKTGANAVKIEGGVEIAETVLFLTKNHIPVMGHIGLMPQSEQFFGGFKVQGKNNTQQKSILNDAIALEKSGVWAVVIECVKESIAVQVTKKLKIPTIGIGASEKCSGQILVTEDMLGLTSRQPKFVKTYLNLENSIKKAVAEYKSEVQQRKFPSKANKYE